MHLFYCPDIVNDKYTLSTEESRHCIKVLRLKIDDKIFLTDGRGKLFETIIIDDNPKRCSLQIVKTEQHEAEQPHIHIAVAPTKNISRFEWFLEKATEIGISEITPLICENSERRIVKVDRLEKVMVAAMKQSLKTHLPKLNEALAFKEIIQKDKASERFIAYCSDEYRDLLKDKAKKGSNNLILIGPEGDFSLIEIQLAFENGFQAVSLGNSRLRTETAALAACFTLNLLNS